MKGARDVNDQQIDLRKENSWVLRAHEISTPEVAEVFAINSISPFVLIARLKSMLIANKADYASDLKSYPSSLKEGVCSLDWRKSVRGATKLRTLNDFILESLRRSEENGKCKEGDSTLSGEGHGTAEDAEEDAWVNSRANHRGAVLEPVRADHCSFVVNVSSMEGKFYRPKTEAHPHTNMAKGTIISRYISIR